MSFDSALVQAQDFAQDLRPRRVKPTLTADQRRRQIIDILAGHLATMPGALAVPPERSYSTPDRSLGQNLPESSQNRLNCPRTDGSV